MTAIRSFAKPGYTPAKHTRIYNDRFYLCTFQNVERDPRSDYIGLAEGEYTELLDGKAARDARDSHLNHLNRCREYTGSVYQLHYKHLQECHSPWPRTIYCQSLDECRSIIAAQAACWPAHIANCRRDLANSRKWHAEDKWADTRPGSTEYAASYAASLDAFAARIDDDERKGYPDPIITTIRR